MKHLRKYNEDLESDLAGIEYVKNCFVEFIDKGAELEIGDDNEYVQITINLPGITYSNGDWYSSNNFDTIEGRIDFHDRSKEFYLDVNNCIDKVKLKYPEKKYNFEVEYEGGDRSAGDYIDDQFDAYLMITYNFDD